MIPLGIDEIIEVVAGRTEVPVKPFGVSRVSTDTRTLEKGDLFLALAGERFDGRRFVAQAFEQGACAAIVSEGDLPSGLEDYGRPVIVVDDARAALARLAANLRKHLAATVIGVTGSNGKTTTKGMIDHVLKAKFPGRASRKSFNNDIGVPLTLLSAESADRYLVVEIGSSAPGEVAALAAIATPNIGVVTSIGQAHVQGLGGIAGVAKEKLSLLTHIAAGGLGVLNLDDFKAVGGGTLPEGLKVLTFGTDAEADIRVDQIERSGGETPFRINGRYRVRLPIPGAHNALNAAAAFAVARRMKMSPEAIVETLADFRLPDMRLHVRRLEGITLIEDCYNANPTSMAAAIRELAAADGGRRVLIAGEMLELGAESEVLHRRVGEQAAEAGCGLVITVGEGARAVARGARLADPEIRVAEYASTEAACEEAPSLLMENDTVLVKGSRAMALEKLCQCIVARSGRAAVTAGT